MKVQNNLIAKTLNSQMPTSSGPRLSWSHPQETPVFAVAPRIQDCDQNNCGILAITLSVVKII